MFNYMIKHLVIPAGGLHFFILYGILKHLNTEGIWKLEHIESIYGTSCGALLAFILSMDLEWEYIDNYLINRPWHTVYDVTPDMFINAIQEKGLINKDYLITFLKPLLRLKEWDETITLKELYDKTTITLNFYATRLDNFIVSVFNHYTEPDMPVLTAIYMSATLPPLLQPIKWNNISYIDGGVIAPNPIHECIYNTNSPDEILTFKLIYKDEQFDFDKANIFSYLQKIITNLVTFTQVEQIETPNQVIVEFNNLYKLSYTDYLKDKELRKKSIEEGYTYAKLYINYSTVKE